MLALLWAAPAVAESDPRFAADHFEPSERGSEWFANESITFPQKTLYTAGVVSSYGERLFVLRDQNGDRVRSPLRNNEVLHLGGNATLFSFVRVSVDLPVQLLAAGKTFRDVQGPKNEQGIGDLRFGADVRVLGHDHDPIRLAFGAQFWAPMGQEAQWLSDDTWRARPRVTVAGEHGIFVWAAQAGVLFRDKRIGSEVGISGAAGLRLAEQLVVGPEFFTSTTTDHNNFSQATTPFEAMLGAHWLIARTVRVGAGISRGWTKAAVDPNYRVLGMIEFAPEMGPPQDPGFGPVAPSPPSVVGDSDHDGVKDDQDACPTVAGIATFDPPTNGCPPDTDGDGINDLGDACPTQPGPASTDSGLNGCPTSPPKTE